jgi:hypothetical protein
MTGEHMLRLLAREGMRVLAKAGMAAADTLLAEVQGAADEAGARVRKTRRKIRDVTRPRGQVIDAE